MKYAKETDDAYWTPGDCCDYCLLKREYWKDPQFSLRREGDRTYLLLVCSPLCAVLYADYHECPKLSKFKRFLYKTIFKIKSFFNF